MRYIYCMTISKLPRLSELLHRRVQTVEDYAVAVGAANDEQLANFCSRSRIEKDVTLAKRVEIVAPQKEPEIVVAKKKPVKNALVELVHVDVVESVTGSTEPVKD